MEFSISPFHIQHQDNQQVNMEWKNDTQINHMNKVLVVMEEYVWNIKYIFVMNFPILVFTDRMEHLFDYIEKK